MSVAASVTRRQFVLISGAVGGALVLGVALRRRQQVVQGGAPARGTLNAYVRIEPDGRIACVMPKVEMGQGVFTSLPMLIAEELEVDLAAITVEAAPPDPAVYGFAVDPAAPEGIERDQSTGTSLSIIQCWTPLRQAGASARLMLIQAAAKRWRVPADTCHAQHGEVMHAASGRRLTYGALAAAAAALPAPAAPSLKGLQAHRSRHPKARHAVESGRQRAVRYRCAAAELEGGTHRALARRGRDDPRARKRCGARRPRCEAGGE